MGDPWSFFALFILNLLVSNIMREIMEESLDEPDEKGPGILANTKTSDWDLPLIYGKCRLGINIVYVGTTGADNKYLHYIGVIGEGPINGIVNEGGTDQLFLNGELWTDHHTDHVYYEIFTGTSTQTVCSTLNTAIPNWTDPLKYTAYIYLRLLYDQDKWVKKPSITLTVEGLKLYDPVEETTSYSNNPALAVYDIMTRSSKRGGMGIAANRIDTDSVEDARDYCTTKGWTANMPINKNDAVADNVQLILNCFRGGLLYSDLKFKLKFKDVFYEDGPVMSFTEDDILDSASLEVTPNSNLFDRPNCVKVIYYNSGKKYIEDSYQYPDSTAIALDGDYREREIKLLGLSTMDKIQPMAYYYLERWRWGNRGNFGVVSKAMSLEPYDLITVNHGVPGWESQLLRVVAPSINASGEVFLSCIEEKTELYDDAYNPPPSSEWHETTLPDPLEVPPSPINISHAEEVYYYRGRSFTRWKIDFDPPTPEDYPFWDYAEIWVKIGAGTHTLDFDGHTGTFIPNMNVVGASSGATGTIASVNYTSATEGKLYLTNVVGAFTDDEIIYESTVSAEYITDSDNQDFTDGTINEWVVGYDGTSAVCEYEGTDPGAEKVMEVRDTSGDNTYIVGNLPTSELTAFVENDFIKVACNSYLESGNTANNIWMDLGNLDATPGVSHTGQTKGQWNALTAFFRITGSDVTGTVSLGITSPSNGDIAYFDDISVKNVTNAALANGTLTLNEYRYMTKSTSDYCLDPVEEGETYYVMLRSVNIYGVKQSTGEAAVVSKTIIGKTTLPSDLSSMTAIANGDTVTIFADPVSDPDIVGYEVRLGDAWDGAVFISFNMNCSLRLVGVRPGTHTFWMSPVDNSGQYSDNPVSASVEVFIPPGFTQLPTYGSWAWDFTTGTLTNTEHTTYSSEDALICSHSGSLTGTWESPTYNLGAIEKVRLWGDFRHAFESTDTTWSGVAPVDVEEVIDNAAAVNKGGGQVGIPITGHGFSASDVIGINGTVNYNGGYTIVSETTNEIVITATYVAETFAGTETVKSGVKWSDMSADTLSWQEIFAPTAAGIVRAQLKYSDSDSGWDTNPYFDFFEILCAEVEAQYVRVKVTITDPTYDSNLYLLELNMLAYEGPQ